MKDFIEKTFPLDKKTITGRSLWKIEKKMVFTSQKISCPLARINPFLDCLLLISIMVSTSSKIALTKKILFPLNRKSVCTRRMKDIQKYVSTTRKKCFFTENLWKNRKKRCPLAAVWFVLKNRHSLISLIVSISRKNSEWKKKCFLQTKYSFPLARMKDWLKNMLQLKNKLLSLIAVDCCPKKMEKNDFHEPENLLHYLKYSLSLKIDFH